MSLSNVEREMQCVTHWFSGWSSFQKQDFQKDLLDKQNVCEEHGEPFSIIKPEWAQYLVTENSMKRLIPNNVDTLFDAMKSLGVSDKPPSIFQCQLKLFSEWFSYWTDAERNAFVLKLQVLDPTFVADLNKEADRLTQKSSP